MRLQQLIILLISIKSVKLQYEAASERRFYNDPELATIPNDIIQCYTNMDLWDRYRRLPTNIESLVAIIRKAELHPAIRNWPPGKLAANLIHKFKFDGIKYDRCVDTSTGALPLKLDLESEFPKMQLIWEFIEGNREDVPEDILEPEEKCALHWMISYSVNTTFRQGLLQRNVSLKIYYSIRTICL